MLIVTANCKNTFDSYLKYVHYTDSKRRKTRFSGATGWLLLACAAAVIVSFVKVGGNIFLYVVSAVLVLCAAAYVYIQYLAIQGVQKARQVVLRRAGVRFLRR